MKNRSKVPRTAYGIAFTSSLGGGFYWPYVNIYAVELGASYSEIGLVSAISNASPTVFQPLWGFLSDRLMKRRIFILLGYLLAGFIVFFYVYAKDPIMYAILLALSMISLSAATPAWNSYIGSFFKKHERARGIGKINGIGFAGTILGAIISGFLMTMVIGEIPFLQYRFSFTVASLLFIITGLLALNIRDPTNAGNGYSLETIVASVKKNSYFQKLLLAESLWSFSMSIAWPMFSAGYIYKFHAKKLEIAMSNIFFNVAFMLSQLYLSFLADVYGRKKAIAYSRFIFPIYPLMWYVAWRIEIVYIANFVVGLANAVSTVAIFAYILDVTEEEERASYFAIYNMILGISQFMGSYIGGLIGDYFRSVLGIIPALHIVFLISSFLRLLTAIPYLFLKETLTP
ncbi:MAG: MFS transporter [Candidatus Njordarchaeales archaeon]